MKFKVVLYETDEGFSIGCPTLPGCWSQGETRDEALENIQIGIREFLQVTWEELNQSIARDLVDDSSMTVSMAAVEVDLEGVEELAEVEAKV